MGRRTLIGVLAAALLGAAWFGMSSLWPAAPAAGPANGPGQRVESVVVAEAGRNVTPVEIGAIGTVQASATVALRSRVEGEVLGIHFREGEHVPEGQLLFTLDARAAEVEVRKAEATLARDRASLENARREVARLQELVAQNAGTRQKLDELRTAAIEKEATVRGDEATLASTQLALGYTRIGAPIAGQAGAIGVQKGNLVKPGENTPLVVIRRVQPIEVAFAVPQKALPAIRAALTAGPVAVTATPPGDDGGPATGVLSFIDNSADPNTGTIGLKATFANADRRLWPGQVVEVVLTLRSERVVTVPAVAVQTGQSGTFVFTVADGTTARQRPVKVARVQRGQAVIEDGLAAGDTVVVDGQFRLAEGTRVEVRPPVGTKP